MIVPILIAAGLALALGKGKGAGGDVPVPPGAPKAKGPSDATLAAQADTTIVGGLATANAAITTFSVTGTAAALGLGAAVVAPFQAKATAVVATAWTPLPVSTKAQVWKGQRQAL